MSNFELVRTGFADTTVGRDRTGVASTSGTAWILALLPAFYLGFVAAALAVGVTDPLVHALFVALFYLAGVALAAVDEHVLRSSGAEETASPFWALLGAVPYLSARARRTDSGLTVLWVGIALVAAGTVVIWMLLQG